jgi:hypothetical protein
MEVELNRRTAPELYIGVESIYFDPQTGTASLLANGSEPVDYLVKMQQFDPNAVLGRQDNNIEISHQQLDALALQIARLHLNAEPVDSSSELGTPEVILRPMADNFKALEICFNFESHPFLQALYNWTLKQYEAKKALIEQRRLEQKIRACHGDLHLDNIAIINQKPVLFDGIEFNDHFRWIDGISDLAFLLMDLTSRQQSHYAWQILSIYLQQTQDYSGLPLLRFYLVYRAMVRAKITNLRAEQLPDGSSEKQRLCSLAGNYVDLAQSLSNTPSRPKLILLQGVSGTGKSHLAIEIQKMLDLVVISSDRTRKALYGIDPLHRVDEEVKKDLYSQKMNAKTYQALLDNAKTSLLAGWHTLVDATFLKYQHREKFYQLARDLELPVYLIYIDSDGDQDSAFLAEQLKQRELADNNPSDADAAIMLQQMHTLEKPHAQEPCIWLNAQKIRNELPENQIKHFLNLPISQ